VGGGGGGTYEAGRVREDEVSKVEVQGCEEVGRRHKQLQPIVTVAKNSKSFQGRQCVSLAKPDFLSNPNSEQTEPSRQLELTRSSLPSYSGSTVHEDGLGAKVFRACSGGRLPPGGPGRLLSTLHNTSRLVARSPLRARSQAPSSFAWHLAGHLVVFVRLSGLRFAARKLPVKPTGQTGFRGMRLSIQICVSVGDSDLPFLSFPSTKRQRAAPSRI